MMRGGIPDKPMLWTDRSYRLIKHNFTDMQDYSQEELTNMFNNDEYIMPIVESDLQYANELQRKGLVPRGHIIATSDEEGNIVHFDDFVPKDSEFYQGLTENTLFTYPKTTSYEIDEFIKASPKLYGCNSPVVIKVAVGGGSRGVVVCNPDHYVENTREQVTSISGANIDEVVKYAKKNSCRILVQDLCRTDLEKYELQIVMREGRLLCYKWDHADNPSTNWDHGTLIRTKYTDVVVDSLVKYLLSLGVYNAFIGMDGYTNYVDYTDLIEVNWRYENCTFTWEAIGVDPISAYIHNINRNDIMPYTDNKGIPYVRYWRCALDKDIPDYVQGK